MEDPYQQDASYRDRFAHEFDEDIGSYEHVLRDEVANAAGAIDYMDFQGDVWKLPREDPDTSMIDGEALDAYHNIEQGNWDDIDLGQVITLTWVLKDMISHADDAVTRQRYEQMYDKAEEMEYVFTLEQEFNDDRYHVADDV